MTWLSGFQVLALIVFAFAAVFGFLVFLHWLRGDT